MKVNIKQNKQQQTKAKGGEMAAEGGGDEHKQGN